MFVCVEVLTCEPIASSNGKAKKVTVNAGSDHGELCIVTNAPNIRQGTRTVAATIGSIVLDDSGEEIVLKEVKVYGVSSQGMICDSAMLNWTGGAKGVCVQVPASFLPGQTAPSSKPRLDGGSGSGSSIGEKGGKEEEVVLSPKELKALEKERKKKEKALLKASGGGDNDSKKEEREKKRLAKKSGGSDVNEGIEGESNGGNEKQAEEVASVFTSLSVEGGVDASADSGNTNPGLSPFKSKDEMCSALLELYSRYGNNDYIGEPVSIIEHSLQAAALAAEGTVLLTDIDQIIAGACGGTDPATHPAIDVSAGGEGESRSVKEVDDCMVLGCLLHDIGHILGLQQAHQAETAVESGDGTPTTASVVPEQMDGCGTMHHEKLGADFLTVQCGLHTRVGTFVLNHVNAKRYFCYKRPEYYSMLSDASKTTLEYQGGVMSLTEALAFEKEADFWKILAMRKIDERAKEVGKCVPGLESYFQTLKQYCSLP